MKPIKKSYHNGFDAVGELALNILICDDDPSFVAFLSEKIAHLPNFSPRSMRIYHLTDPEAILQEDFTRQDILFLDIDMGEINGINLARQIRKVNQDIVLIFVTNFKEYAPEGYEVNAFRYLGKAELDAKLAGYFSQALSVCQKRKRCVEIICGGEPLSVPLVALVYIESLGREQCLHLKDVSREKLLTRATMAELEKLLTPHGFLRIHKSYLVNMEHLQSMRSTGARLTTGEALPVGTRSYRENKQQYLAWKGRQAW